MGSTIRRESGRLHEHFTRARPRRLAFYFLLFFASVHALYFLVGVRFDAGPISGDWYQYLDPQLLRNDLARSLFYLHIQPPLYNLFLGLVLKVGGDAAPVLFHGCYLACGLTLALCILMLQLRLGVSNRIAFVITALFTASPAFILYEHCLFYAFPVTAVMALSAFCFVEFLRTRKTWPIVLLAACLLALCGTWSLFHLAYLLCALGLLLRASTGSRRKVAIIAAVPLILVLSLYAKNYVLFGHFAPGTWMGMNFWRMTTGALNDEERRQLAASGVISEVSLIEPFSPLEDYPREYRERRLGPDVPALTQTRKSTGWVNYNHQAYIPISEQYLRDDLRVLAARPRSYLRALMSSWLLYIRSATTSAAPGMDNARNFPRFVEAYDYIFFGKKPFPKLEFSARWFHNPNGPCLFFLVGFPLLIAFAFWKMRRRLRPEPLPDHQRFLLAYLLFNILYVALVGNSLEVGENNRFRFTTDPLYAVLLGFFLEYAVKPRVSGFLAGRRRRETKTV
jgi:hypothetical protein